MQYERSITSGLEVMAKVKVFVHATDADAHDRAKTPDIFGFFSKKRIGLCIDSKADADQRRNYIKYVLLAFVKPETSTTGGI